MAPCNIFDVLSELIIGLECWTWSLFCKVRARNDRIIVVMAKRISRLLDSFNKGIHIFLIGAVFCCTSIKIVEVDLGLITRVCRLQLDSSSFVASFRFQRVPSEMLMVANGKVTPLRKVSDEVYGSTKDVKVSISIICSVRALDHDASKSIRRVGPT